MLSCQTPEGHAVEARAAEGINFECHRRRTGLAQFQLRRVFVDTVQPHVHDRETDLQQFDHCESIGAVRIE